ncbi:MAG: hypothetical protein NC241_04005 [Bacteroides sp.]|nr:hypothetical protein [Bacteroides sp.]
MIAAFLTLAIGTQSALKAQVSISYSDIEPAQPDTTAVDVSIAPADNNAIYGTNPNENETTLRYAWVNHDYLVKSVESLRNLKDIYDRQLLKLNEQESKGIEVYTEKSRAYEEWVDNTLSICASAAIDLGYIPLDFRLKEHATGNFTNLPDITFELQNKLRNGEVTPCPEKLPGTPDLNIAIAFENLCMDGWTYQELENKLSFYASGYWERRKNNPNIDSEKTYTESVFNKLHSRIAENYKALWDKMPSIVAPIEQRMKLDGVIFAIGTQVIAPLLVQNMTDISYILMQQLENEPISQDIKNILPEIQESFEY